VNTRLFMKDASIRIVVPPGPIAGATEYSCDVNTVEVLSSPGDRVDYQTLCPNGVLSQTGPSTYSVHLKGVQDWATDGLSLFLWQHAGVTARLVVQAHGQAAAYAAATPGFDCSVVLIEGTYGGESGKFAEFDVEFPCTVRPTLLTTAPTSDAPAGDDQLALDAAAA
jgi:hypothetical protein